MSTGYGWEGIRQVCATLLGARHVPERLCGGPCLQRGAITSARPLPYLTLCCKSLPLFFVNIHITERNGVERRHCSQFVRVWTGINLASVWGHPKF